MLDKLSRRLDRKAQFTQEVLREKHHNKLEKMVRWKRSQEVGSLLSVAGTDVAIGAVKQEEDVEWDSMFELLKTFKNVEGHCHADRVTSDPALGRWGESSRCIDAMSCFAIIGLKLQLY